MVLWVVFVCLAVWICLVDRQPLHLEILHPEVGVRQGFDFYIDSVVNGTLGGPYIYRILMPYAVYFLGKALPNFTALDVDFLFKILLVLGCQIAFYRYLLLFFDRTAALLGTLLLDLYLNFGLSHIQGPSNIETGDLFNALVFVLGLLCMYRNRFGSLLALLAVGMLNRETPMFLLPVLFWEDRCQGRPVWRTLAAIAVAAIPYFGLRLLIEAKGEVTWFMFALPHNLPFVWGHTRRALIANLRLFFLLAPLAATAVWRFREQPAFLRTAALMSLPFLAVHYLVGSVLEVRLWMPLFVFLIPLSAHRLQVLLARDIRIMDPRA